MRWAALPAVFAPWLCSQSLNVYSEFARIDGNGVVTAPENPREILSPALVRNGFTSFQVVVDAPQGTQYRLLVGLNPPDAVKVTLYRESADRLQRVDPPIDGDGPAVFWMDVWCDRAGPVRRVKIEPELYAAGDWIRYPMEARVMDATVPEAGHAAFPDTTELPCAPTRRDDASDSTRFHERNRAQDAALASRIPKAALLRAVGDCDSSNPEAYLRIRDYLFRLR